LSDIKEKRIDNQKITFIFDSSIIGPLNLLIPGSLLKDEGNFQLLNIIPEKKEEFETYNEILVYFSRPRIELMKMVASHIKAFKDKQKKIYLFLIPRTTLICEVILQDEGVFDMIQQPIGEYSADLIPIDNDLISMEIPYGFKEYYVVFLNFKKRMEIIQVCYFWQEG